MQLNERYNSKVQDIIKAVLTTPGATDPALRRAIESRAAELGGRVTESKAGEIPPGLAAYVDKVALHAYKTTDAHIEALKEAGYSEDAIFEMTLSAALGAGTARLARGLAALRGGQR